MALKRDPPVRVVLSFEERDRLVKFFSILIDIDQRIQEAQKEAKKKKKAKDNGEYEGARTGCGLSPFLRRINNSLLSFSRHSLPFLTPKSCF